MSSSYELSDKELVPDPNRKYVLVMGCGFFGVFMAFNTAQALQSTVNQTLGNACLCTLYATFTIACLAGPMVVDKFGPRISMIVGAVTYVAMVLSNLKPSWGLSIPMYFLVGVGAPLLWTGQAVYLSRCATQSAGRELSALRQAGEEGDLSGLVKAKQELYNGYFFSFFQANGALGLLMASCIQLKTDNVKFLFVVLSVICGVGVAIITFGIPNVKNMSLEQLQEDSEEVEAQKNDDAQEVQEEEPGFLQQLWETLRFGVTEPRLYFFLPMMVYNGMSLGFMLSDFTRYIVDESLGNKRAGFVVSAFYACNLLATMFAGKALIRRSLLVAIAAALHLAYLLLIFFNRPWLIDTHGSITADSSSEPSRWYLNSKDDWTEVADGDTPISAWVSCFVLACLFACGDAVWESQIPAVLGGYFPTGKENSLQAANFKMWQSFGFAAMFGLDVLLPKFASNDGDSTYVNGDSLGFKHINDLFYVKVLILLFGLLVSTTCVWYTHKFVPGGALDYETTGNKDELTDPLNARLSEASKPAQ